MTEIHSSIMFDKKVQLFIKDLESCFGNLNKSIETIRNEKLYNFDEAILNQIKNSINDKKDFIDYLLNRNRNELLTQLNGEYRKSLIQLKLLNQIKVKFNSKEDYIYNDYRHLIGSLFYRKKFTLKQTFKYFEFLNLLSYEIIFEKSLLNGKTNESTEISTSLTTQQVNISLSVIRILVLETNKIFVYYRNNLNETYFKIFNFNFNEIQFLKLASELVYKNILTVKNKIVSLFYNSNIPITNNVCNVSDGVVRRQHSLSIYNDNLNQITTKNFYFELNFCSINQFEIICWNINERKCYIFDHFLNVNMIFGQEFNPSSEFYFKNGTLIDASETLILFYSWNEDEQAHCVKIIDRKSGLLNGIIEFEFNYFTKMIKIDSKSNILVRLYEPNNLFKYFDSNGNLICLFQNNDFNKFSRIDLNKNDELICYTRNDKIFIY